MERSDLIATNTGIVKKVTQQVAKYSPHSVIVVVSNPLDVLCYCAWKNSGFPSNKVMGMSGQFDVARYQSFIAEALNVSMKDIQALILGGHGKSMVSMLDKRPLEVYLSETCSVKKKYKRLFIEHN